MKKSTNHKKSYLVGAAILAAGGIFAKFLGMFFKIPLANTIGNYGLGLYSYAYPLYTAFLSISTVGLPVAVSKMVSERVSVGNYRGAYKVFYIAFTTLAVLGAVASIVMFAGANFFISVFHWDKNAYYCILSLSIAPFFVSMVSACRGFFQGMQCMSFSSLSQIIDQIGRVGIGLALALILTSRFGVEMGAAGATFGATAGAISAFVFLYISFLIYRAKQKPMFQLEENSHKESTKTLFKTMVLLAIPVAAGGLVNTIMELINSATIAGCLQKAGIDLETATAQFGLLEQKAQTLVNVPLVLGSALSASLVPSISESFARKEKRKAIEKTSLAIRVAFLVGLPSTIGLSVLSAPIIELLFGTPDGSNLLTGLAFVVVFTAGMSTLQGILQGSGHFYRPLKNLAIGAVLKFILNLLLISNSKIGVYGAVISSVIASIVIFTLNLIDTRKLIGTDGKVIKSIMKILLSAVVMGAFAKVSFSVLSEIVGGKLGVLLSIILAAGIYFVCIIATRAFTKEDFRKVRG